MSDQQDEWPRNRGEPMEAGGDLLGISIAAPLWSATVNSAMRPARRPENKLICRQCGQPEAHAIGDEILCASCCHERGSCGAGDERPPRPADTGGYASPACSMPEIAD
jgi:hypothetical protein